MKENKIDKIFNEGLKGGKMPYSEDFWTDMESLLPPTTAPLQTAKTTTGLGARLVVWFIGISVVGALGYLWASKTSSTKEWPTSVIEIQNEEDYATTPAPDKNESISDVQNETSPNDQMQKSPTRSSSETTTTIEENIEIAAQNKYATAETTTEAVSEVAEANGRNALLVDQSGASSTNNNENILAGESDHSSLPTTPTLADQSEKSTTKARAEIIAANNITNVADNDTSENKNLADATPMAMATKGDETSANLNETSQSKEEKTEVSVILPHQKGKKLLWSAGIDYQYLLINRSLLSPNSNAEDYINFRSTYENPLSQSSVGANVQLEVDKWLMHTGIYSTTIREQINYPTTLLVDVGVDNGQWQINEWWKYTVDSTWVIDSIFAGHWQLDTAWTVTYDSLWNPQWDTVAVEKEAPELAMNNRIFNLSYVEIPLWFGRSFGEKNWHFDAQVGVAFGLLSGTKGSVYINRNVDGLVTATEQLAQFNQLQISGMLRAGIRYEFTEQLQVLLYPTVRYSLNSVFKESGIRQRYFGYGTSLGIIYRF